MTGSNTHVLRLLQLLGHQDRIRFGVRDRIIRRFCHPDVVDPSEFEVEFFGLKYQGNLNCYIDWMVYFYGAYQKYELFCLRDLLQDSARPVFFDIGANVGQHSLFLSRYCDRVHAFEPYELVRRQLELKIRHNDIGNIVVHAVGLGQQDSQLDYFAPRGCNTGTGSFVPSYATDNNRLIGKLPVVNADRYIAGLGLPKLDLIKIDVEGYEKNVLLGLKDTLREYRPVLFMEFSAETKHSFQGEDEMLSMLPGNYGIKRVLTNRPRFAVLANPGYTFSHFDFDVSGGNIVLSPSEQ